MRKSIFLPLSSLLLVSQILVADELPDGVTEIGKPEINVQTIRPRTKKPVAMESVNMTSPGVVEIGEPDMDVSIVKQSGANKPLPEALRAILPRDWHAKKNRSVDRSMRISWTKGADWLTVLNDVAIDNRLSISVDWPNQTVTVLNQAPAWQKAPGEGTSNSVFTMSEGKWNEMKSKTATAKDSPLPMPGKPTTLPEKQSEPVKPVEKPTPPPVKISPPLRLVKGQWLKQCVENWTKEIGWNLAWSTTQDIQLEADSTFSGTPEEIAVKFEDSLHHGGFKLHVEGHRLNNTIEVIDI